MFFKNKEPLTLDMIRQFLEEGREYSRNGYYSVLMMPGEKSRDYIMEYYPEYHYEKVDPFELKVIIYNHFWNKHGIDLDKRSIATALKIYKRQLPKEDKAWNLKLIKLQNFDKNEGEN